MKISISHLQRRLAETSPLFIVFVSTCHIVSGILIVCSADALNSTPFSSFKTLLPAKWHVVHGLILIGAAVLALLSMRFRRYYYPLIFMQQVLLVTSAMSCTLAIVNGHYADMEERSRFFIASDQIWVITACICHAFALGAER